MDLCELMLLTRADDFTHLLVSLDANVGWCPTADLAPTWSHLVDGSEDGYSSTFTAAMCGEGLVPAVPRVPGQWTH
eukprot:6089578-Prorocentrum_lima.AAC.1